jgi:ATP-dependent Lhr-like helicase
MYQKAIKKVSEWFQKQGWKPFDFQTEVWEAYVQGKSGLIHASTGTGKTYAVWMGAIIKWLADHPQGERQEVSKLSTSKRKRARGSFEPLHVLWITPLRALALDTQQALLQPINALHIPWSVEIRSGDTPGSLRQKQAKRLPTTLITTPESLSLLLSYADAKQLFANLQAIIVDEWHELLSSKRGVLTELSLAHLRTWHPRVRIWGLSATLGNTAEAMQVLLGDRAKEGRLIRGLIPRKIQIDTIIPDEIERFPRAGHLGLKLLPQVIEKIEQANSVLLFTNTRSQTETWYQSILETRPDWAGIIALHHGSLDKKNRMFVEDALREGRLKCVVCTSSLDLGVDFSPVDRVIQVGSVKGVARLLQRAGRSGHQPDRESRIICVPTNAFELIEITAARQAMSEGFIEPRNPITLPLDVLSQHLVTMALGGGFRPEALFHEVTSTYSFESLTRKEWDWLLDFISRGGPTLTAYPEFSRVMKENGHYIVNNPKIARRHRMSIGTISGDTSMQVKYLKGGTLGTIEESFIAKLKKGSIFVFAGRILEFVRIKDMTVLVRKAKDQHGSIPQWMGSRMPLSTELASAVRTQFHQIRNGGVQSPEIIALKPILDLQSRWSIIPAENELLIERLKTREGYHLFIYAFEGHLIHEGLAALIGYRLSQHQPITFSIAVNDYGFELLSDQEIPFEAALDRGLFNVDALVDDILESINSAEMAKRQFREIARIAGLVFQGYPGSPASTKHLQASSSLFFEVFQRYDPENLLLRQSVREVLENHLKNQRIRAALQRMTKSTIQIVNVPHPTPLAFPIMVNRMRARVSSERLADRIQKMQVRLEKEADNAMS